MFGIAAVALLLVVRARVEYEPPTHTSSTRQVVPLLVMAVLLLGLLAAVGYALAPWLGSIFGGFPVPRDSVGNAIVNSWLPPLVSAVVGVFVALLGGIGIGVFRPLRANSERLLLIFAPWLFVGVGPLLIADNERASGQDDTFLGLIPPTWLSIPALVVFTLLFRGLSGQWRAAGAENQRLAGMVALPALPMLGGAVVVAWLVGAQQLLWPMLTVNSYPGVAPAGLLEYIYGFQTPARHTSVLGLVYPLPLLLLFVLVFMGLGIFYLKRLAIQVGPESQPAPSPGREGSQQQRLAPRVHPGYR